ncbi:hypothetical protein ABB37_05344 [Leptomonas pyrrhocoris]|uniref:Uncharacterized protein n=1 Tax=Leptomonas pyrrhocoris TaxID=157538 RepID=A0A0N0VEX0_LEPPY|nr:hypothetical protein ABB37_05344 [Leptomonas pyrrhocoris]KPA79521.1 hypothetical protein ABB37_05344 [Leptomonas pyrrhocoris]|eukprot:XP_015657960.1 hypothetical protein ABB37_05344 [Leptomonas pyrrhocoris]
MVHDGDDVTQAAAALSTGDALRGCVDPTAHYIFRNCIRAPRAERPKPYLYIEDPSSLALAAVRLRRDERLPAASATSKSEEAGASHEPAAAAATAPQQGRSGEREVAVDEAASSQTWSDEPTSSSSQMLPRTAHAPMAEAATEEGNKNRSTNEKPKLSSSDSLSPPLSAEEVVPVDAANKINRTYLITGALHAEPISAADISKEELIIDIFNALPSEQRRMEILEAFYVAHLQPYEQNASYTGDDWDDMTETKVPRWFGVEFDTRRGCFFVTVFRRRVRIFLFSFLFRALRLFFSGWYCSAWCRRTGSIRVGSTSIPSTRSSSPATPAPSSRVRCPSPPLSG